MKRMLWMALGGLLLAACGSGGVPATTGGGSGGASSAVATKYTVGQPVAASDGRSVTVVAFKHGYSTGNEFEVPKAGHEFLLVTYALSNGSKSEWQQPLFELGVVDANGQKYNSTFATGQDNVDSLVAGGKAPAVKQIYEVPVGTAIDVVWRPSMFENTVYQVPLA